MRNKETQNIFLSSSFTLTENYKNISLPFYKFTRNTIQPETNPQDKEKPLQRCYLEQQENVFVPSFSFLTKLTRFTVSSSL
jgi:hypothetical protein